MDRDISTKILSEMEVKNTLKRNEIKVLQEISESLKSMAASLRGDKL